MRTKTVILSAAILVATLFFQTPFLAASQKSETSDFYSALKAALDLAAFYGGANKVLVIFDVDNTLLKSATSLGSDQWFNWQLGMILSPPAESLRKYVLAKDRNELLDLQGTLYERGSMVPPESESPLVVKALQDLGFSCMVLTSRGTKFKDATMRELRRNGYEFRDRAPLLNGDPYADPDDGLDYADGVFLTSGADKGLMLSSFLGKLAAGSEYKAIVFMDDSLKNTESVSNMPDGSAFDMSVIRYAREDSVVRDFKANRDGIWDIVKDQGERIKPLTGEKRTSRPVARRPN